ncbi:response regulator [Subsaximicrobium wynnwilliamsii]|uniref:histidine kinase n=1 Tax=Subsaximicrobium wynnwilliamsii TaxID=291179 RepID=A0A5C6ZK95_9FLAO|nr:ATP-binding protein [Subsaximicrobium wynnwilliamsii]TXD84577.1 response regulator [Subsaximicrobium wynnwilliamsii]TXD90259.1 response regulator [Subsaximicrobium wynnwilliamsii]TXE04310.1 response regulator [Subsaximicrobium wynnwilliamsii]
MSKSNNFISIFFMLLACVSFAQDLDTEDPEVLKLRMENNMLQSEFDIGHGNYFNAKDNLERAMALAIRIEDKKSEGFIHTRIGKLQHTVKEFDKAFVSLTKAAEIQRELNDYKNLAITYSIRGSLHASKNEYQNALDYYNSAKTLFHEHDLEKLSTEVMLNEAKIYYELEEYDNSKVLLDEVIENATQFNQKNTLSSAMIYNGKTLNRLNQEDLAITAVSEGLSLAKSNDYLETINEAYLTFNEIFQKKEDYKAAHNYLLKHMQLSDSILNVERKNLTPESRAAYLEAYSIADYEKMKKQLEDIESESSLSRITTILSIALISILSLLTLALYKNNNIRLKSNNMLLEKNDDLVEAMRLAELASKTKANFLSTVTHELRTPLYAVTGLTNMLLEEEPTKEQIPHLKSLKFSGDYLLQFINDILQINKIEANKVDLDPILFNLKTKVENVCSALNNSALDNNVILHYEFQKDLEETFIGDNLKISQILINLIGNSIKFTKDGDIWVRVYSISKNGNEHLIRFEIEDNGIGISKEKQEHMFESFSQGSIQINRKYGGTGLGLSIVKGLIDILKGNIYLKSDLGKGTTFFFEIPLTYAPESVKIEKVDYSKNISSLDIKNIKILIVEDNKINQMITKKILTKMNLECEVVDNGEDAVEKVRENRYDVVLMDIHMPGISGLEATKIIRGFDKTLTIFALTAVTLEDKMHEFDEAGFDDIISKPFKQEDFEKKLFDTLSSNANTIASA